MNSRHKIASKGTFIDHRLIPDIFSFSYPKSFWVRALIAIEIFCAVVAVIGTLILAILPRSYTAGLSATSSVSVTR